jgi:hypothetical protein
MMIHRHTHMICLNLSTIFLFDKPIHCIILTNADVSDIVNVPQFFRAQVSILMSGVAVVVAAVVGVRLSGLPIPVTRTVVAPDFFARSND